MYRKTIGSQMKTAFNFFINSPVYTQLMEIQLNSHPKTKITQRKKFNEQRS